MKNEEIDEDIDLFGLFLKLRREQLLVKTEKNKIQELNELIRNKINKIVKVSWIVTKQRLLLFERESTSKNSRKFDQIGKSDFVDAKQALGFQVQAYITSNLKLLQGYNFVF